MRNNGPVTDQCVNLGDNQKLFSVTDAKGVITSVNQELVDISGFSENELIGQAHNIVRHPWMPQLAFKELWDFNKSQRPWMGLVKNRCKNGDHYWVDAFVSPIYKNGEVVGYQSVRQKAGADAVDRAKDLYQNKGNGSRKLFARLQAIPLNLKLFLSFGVCALLSFGLMAATQSLALSIGFVLVSFFVVASLVAKPWMQYADTARSIYDSAMACKVYTGRYDELGQIQLAMKFLKSQQDTILYRAKRASDLLKESSSDSRSQVDSVIKDIESLYSEVEAATTAIGQMSSTVQGVASNATDTSAAAEESKNSVDFGKTILEATKRDIGDLANAVEKSSEKIQELSENSSAIGSVVEVISGIADQTNLLALNAAIEAARAGEQGRGFAVVADEVRSLAAKTQESTGQISEMILALQTGTNLVVESIDNSHSQVQASVDNIGKLENQFTTILENVEEILGMCVQTATATEEQSVVAGEINGNISNINSVGQKTVKSTHKLKEASEQIDIATGRMSEMVKQFD